MKTCYNLFVGLLITVLYFNCTNAAITYPCPAGCFCIGTGSFEPIIQVSSNIEDIVKKECEQASAKANGISSSSAVTLCNSIAIVSSSSRDAFKNIARSIYYTDDFSVYYNGSFGFYGFKNDGEFVYFLGGCNNDKNERSYTYSQIYNCPESFPNSDKGSKSLADCFRYNADGDKVYYGDTEPRIKTKLIDYNGWVPLVSCQPGYYMPANSTKCSSCSGNNACPGGMFYTDKTYTADRGIIACENGVSSDRTSCRANGTTTTTTTSPIPPATTTTTTTTQSSSGNNVSAGTTTTTSTSGGNNDSDTTATTPSSGTVSSSGTGGGTTSTIAKISDLNPATNGSQYSQNEGTKTWSVKFPYGYVRGIASCNDTSGTYATAYSQYNFDNNHASSTGKYCWCKMTTPSSAAAVWTASGSMNSSSNCATSCASRCGMNTKGDRSFRTSIFGLATNGNGGGSSSSNSTDPNADIKAKLQNGALSKLFGLGGKSAVPQVGRAAVYDGVPSRGASISIAGKAANQRSATGTNDAQRSSTLDKAVRENPRGTNKSNRN